MAYDPWGEVPAGWSVDFVVMPVRGMCRWSRRSIPLDALGEALAWSLYPAVVALAVLTESEVPAGPGFATNLGRLEVLLTRRRSPALQAGSSPKDRAMGHVRFTEPSFRTRHRGGQPVFKGR